jgi:hypothetical protein
MFMGNTWRRVQRQRSKKMHNYDLPREGRHEPNSIRRDLFRMPLPRGSELPTIRRTVLLPVPAEFSFSLENLLQRQISLQIRLRLGNFILWNKRPSPKGYQSGTDRVVDLPSSGCRPLLGKNTQAAAVVG